MLCIAVYAYIYMYTILVVFYSSLAEEQKILKQ